MKAWALLLSLVVFSPLVGGGDLPDEIKLTNGFVMRQCEILRWDKDSVLVRYVGGTVPIKFANMDADTRAVFELESKTALKKQRTQDEAHRQVQSHAQREQGAPAPSEDSAKQEAEERAQAEIDHGVTWHYLVKGMTPDQVRLAFGAPTSTSESSSSAWWTFAGRSKYVWSSDGTPKDVTVYFTNGRLTGWDNYSPPPQ